MNKKTVVIIGGGASGTFCAINIKKQAPHFDVLLLEQNDRICKKVLKTGNGKCNIGNINITKDKYNDFTLLKNNIDSFNLFQDFFDLGLILKTDTEGRVYPYSETATSVVEGLKKACENFNVDVKCNQNVISVIEQNEKFIIKTKDQTFIADYLVIATGSNAQESTNGYKLLENLNHSITKLTPSLVSMNVKEKVKHMQGIRVKCYENNYKLKGEILFKENGISGILAMDLSRLVNENDVLSFNLIKGVEESVEQLLRNDSDYEQALRGVLPKMVAYDVYTRSDKTIAGILNVLQDYKFTVIKKDSFEKAQITKGGVSLNQIFDDFSSKIIKNLYIIGEVLDVDGACGGYNLYFAWMSAKVVSKKITCNI